MTNILVQILDTIRRDYKVDISFPVAELTVVCGFLVVVVIEQCVLSYQERWTRRQREEREMKDRSKSLLMTVFCRESSGDTCSIQYYHHHSASSSDGNYSIKSSSLQVKSGHGYLEK